MGTTFFDKNRNTFWDTIIELSEKSGLFIPDLTEAGYTPLLEKVYEKTTKKLTLVPRGWEDVELQYLNQIMKKGIIPLVIKRKGMHGTIPRYIDQFISDGKMIAYDGTSSKMPDFLLDLESEMGSKVTLLISDEKALSIATHGVIDIKSRMVCFNFDQAKQWNIDLELIALNDK